MNARGAAGGINEKIEGAMCTKRRRVERKFRSDTFNRQDHQHLCNEECSIVRPSTDTRTHKEHRRTCRPAKGWQIQT